MTKELPTYGSEAAPKNWVVNITKLLEEKDAIETPVCILKVPKMLRDIKPEDYSPQLIGLGPYHHWRPDLYEMELYKLIAAKKAAEKTARNDQDQAVEILKGLVDGLKEDCPQIRACYDHNLEADDEQLAWMMVIDAIFLLQFLQAFVHKERSYLSDYKRMSYLVDPTQSAYHSILKDMMKLENQIPMIVLKQITAGSALNVVGIHDEYSLLQLLSTTCRKLSPLKVGYESSNYWDDINKASHLLDMLYHMIVPSEFETDQHKLSHLKEDCPPHPKYKQPTSSDDLGDHPDQQRNRCKNCLSDINVTDAVVHLIKNLNVQFANLRVFGFISKLTQVLLPTVMSSRKENNSTSNTESAPTLEEIEIPSASELLDVGVNFCPSDGSPITSCILFDKRTRKFHLPIIHIDGNTEVIMRNLVAYEGAAISGSLVLARYTELMNGIIDTPEDVRLLRKRGIIVSYLKRDEDVANMWNLMSRSIRLSHVPSIDKAIDEVNNYYARRKRVRFVRFTKECLSCAWKFLMLFLALLLLVLIIIQSFCDVYQCSQVIAAAGGSKA